MAGEGGQPARGSVRVSAARRPDLWPQSDPLDTRPALNNLGSLPIYRVTNLPVLSLWSRVDADTIRTEHTARRTDTGPGPCPCPRWAGWVALIAY